jgi:hypothetical protein
MHRRVEGWTPSNGPKGPRNRVSEAESKLHVKVGLEARFVGILAV